MDKIRLGPVHEKEVDNDSDNVRCRDRIETVGNDQIIFFDLIIDF
jgi:hypothetical protein